MPVSGTETVAQNIVKFGAGFKKHVQKTMITVAGMLDVEVTRNMSLSEHSLRDLARQGHPYASRHGPEGMPIHDPHWQVHIQSGQLLASKRKGVSEVEISGGRLSVSAFVGLDENAAKHALNVIWGTSVMIPRDFLSGSLFNPEFMKEAKAHLETNLRDFVFNFKGAETK